MVVIWGNPSQATPSDLADLGAKKPSNPPSQSTPPHQIHYKIFFCLGQVSCWLAWTAPMETRRFSDPTPFIP